ncbi:hypothetical protein M0804_015447 [Polistes exclamans]|nr:hypothetical protein M0804_015447 [Polistes exclamans]
MSSNDSLHEDDEIANYVSKALEMMLPYSSNEEEKFHEWVNQFEYAAHIIGVPNNRMLEFFYKMVDNDFHSSVRIINSIVEFPTLSYEQTLELYHKFFSSNTNTNLHRRRFFVRNQYKEEPIEHYANCLHEIYNKCNYTNRTNERLCEKFIKGICDKDIKNYLSNTPKLSFNEMVAKAIEFEKANDITYYRDKALSMIQTYSPKKEGLFHVWLNKFEYIADIIEIPKYRMLELFNKMVDNYIHVSVQMLNYDVNFFELSYEEIIDYYLGFFALSDELFLHRSRFMCRNQYEKETIKNYADSLRKIFNRCIYKDCIEKRLCEQFIKGIRDNNIKNYLSDTPKLSFNEMVAKAIEFENANDITHYQNTALSMINIYIPKKEGVFTTWLNKFEYIADIIEVPKNKMIEFFNKMVDNYTRKSVQELYSSVNFSRLSYEELISYYLRFFCNTDKNSAYRKRFSNRNQYQHETIQHYADTLRKLYDKCGYTSLREERLQERFTRGVCDLEIRSYLIKKMFPKFDDAAAKAIQLAKMKIFA